MTEEMLRAGQETLFESCPEYTIEEREELAKEVYLAMLGAAPPQDTITVQEAWEAAGGNHGIKPTKSDLIHTLQTMDAAVDEAAEIRRTFLPAPAVPLSDERLKEIAHALWIDDGDILRFARAIEAAHGIERYRTT